jgi:hypothetical protein
MILGFTGTRQGMTPKQLATVRAVAERYYRTGRLLVVRHGACAGADREFHATVVNQPEFHAEPTRMFTTWLYPSNAEQRTWALAAVAALPPDAGFVVKTQPPLERNKRIVGGSDLLIAAPRGFTEEVRSGTWATVRYARERRVAITIVWPDGRKTEE